MYAHISGMDARKGLFPHEFITNMSMKSIFRMTDGPPHMTVRDTLKAGAVNGAPLTYCMCH